MRNNMYNILKIIKSTKLDIEINLFYRKVRHYTKEFAKRENNGN